MLLLVFRSNVVASCCILPQNLRDYSKILVKTAKSCSNLKSPDQRILKREGETSLINRQLGYKFPCFFRRLLSACECLFGTISVGWEISYLNCAYGLHVVSK